MNAPVYIVTGFLESGKTRFISEMLADDGFTEGERTLLLCCEEGEEEYDPKLLKRSNTVLVNVSEMEDIQGGKLVELDREYRPERVLIEDRATSTRENLEFSFDIIRSRGDEPSGNVAIVSSAYHLYRAKCMAEKLGIADPAGVAAPWGYFFVMLNYFIREAFGVTHLWVLGW